MALQNKVPEYRTGMLYCIPIIFQSIAQYGNVLKIYAHNMNNNITTEIVYEVLTASLSQDNAIRSAAEKQLHEWESDSVPGFIGALLKIAQEVQNVSEVKFCNGSRKVIKTLAQVWHTHRQIEGSLDAFRDTSGRCCAKVRSQASYFETNF